MLGVFLGFLPCFGAAEIKLVLGTNFMFGGVGKLCVTRFWGFTMGCGCNGYFGVAEEPAEYWRGGAGDVEFWVF